MRKDARVNAFILIFEGLFHDCDENLSKDNLKELKKEDDQKFFEEIMSAFKDHREEIKQMIEKHLQNFEYDRLFKVDLALITLATTEILFCNTPKAVAINEALEIAKKYSTSKSHKFINGILSAMVKEI